MILKGNGRRMFFRCALAVHCILLATVVSAGEVPQILDLSYRPAPFDAGSGIEVVPKLLDADNADVEYYCRWFVNEEEVEEVHDVLLPGEYFERGDQVSVEVTPEWNGQQGKAVKSGTVEASNAPPQIVSTPPQQIVQGLFSYLVEAVDADDDSLVYSLSVAPDGMQLDSESGLLTWLVSSRHEKVVAVTVKVEDGYGGQVQQQFNIKLSYTQE